MIRFVVLIVYFNMLVLALTDNVRGPLLMEVVKDFQVSQTIASLFFAVASFTGFISGFFVHKLISTTNIKTTFLLGCVFQILSMLFFGLSQSYYLFLVGSVFLGISFSVLGVCQNVLINTFAPKNNLVRFQSGLHSIYGLGSFLAPVIVTLALWLGGTWQQSFLIIALGSVLSLFSIVLVKWQDKKVALESIDHAQIKGSKIFSLVLAFYVAVELMVSTRISLYMREVYNMNLQESGEVASQFFGLMFFGRILFIFFKPNIKVETQLILSLVTSTISILLGVFWRFEFLVLSGLLLAPFYPLAMAYAGKVFSDHLSKVTSEAITFSAMIIVSMHLSVGVLTDFVGIKFALLSAVIFSMVSLVLAQVLFRLKKS